MKYLISGFIFLFCSYSLEAQERLKKVEFFGKARTNLLHQNLIVENDSTNAKKANYGHSLIDLGVLIRPSKSTEIITDLRIRNEHGGFFGGAVTFGVRRLTLKGIIDDKIRYNIGDIDLKITPYTLYNNSYQTEVNEATIFSDQRSLISYENYFKEHYWRQQGAQLEFAFVYPNSKLQEIDFNVFTTRHNTAVAASSTPERLFSGFSIVPKTILGKFGIQTVYLYDLKNTINDIQLFSNRAHTLSGILNKEFFKNYNFFFETGYSKTKIEDLVSNNLNEIEDYFWNIGFKTQKFWDLDVELNALNNGAYYRAPGAQNIRLNYLTQSGVFNLISNEQVQRPIGILDYLYNDVNYFNQFDESLDAYNPIFNNVMPYGQATPNRRGLSLQLTKKQLLEGLTLNLNGQMYSEIIGVGTEELKIFKVYQSSLNYKYNRFTIKLGVKHENTKRDGANFEKIDLWSRQIDGGLDIELMNDLEFISGIKIHEASGNEFLLDYDILNNPFIMTPTFYNMKQVLSAVGLRLSFGSHSALTTSYNIYSYEDSNIDYSINQFQILYKLNF